MKTERKGGTYSHIAVQVAICDWPLNNYYSCNNNSLKRRATPIFKKQNGCRPLEFRGTTIGSTPLKPEYNPPTRPGPNLDTENSRKNSEAKTSNPPPGSTRTGGQKPPTLHPGLPGQGGKSKTLYPDSPEYRNRSKPPYPDARTEKQKQQLYSTPSHRKPI